MNKLSIIIPVFNEEKTIGEILKRVKAATLPAGMQKEIIVIDDGSTDKTWKVLSEFRIDNLSKILYFCWLKQKHPAGHEYAMQEVLMEISFMIPIWVPWLAVWLVALCVCLWLFEQQSDSWLLNAI